jgi:hypothetical protein
MGSEGFWSKDIWPPSSPNLNPLDFFVWRHVKEKACVKSHPNKKSLMTAVNTEWEAISVADLKKVCKALKPRLEACINVQGGIFEK